MADKTFDGHPADPRASLLWWGYFALIVVLFVVTSVNFAVAGFHDSFGGMLTSAALLTHDALCIAGLYAFIRSVPLFAPAFWRIVLTLLLARIFLSASILAPSLIPWAGSREQYVAAAGLGMLILGAPLLAALWRYAFRSPGLWNRAAA